MRVDFHSCTSQQLQSVQTGGGETRGQSLRAHRSWVRVGGGHVPFGCAPTLLRAWSVTVGLVLPFLHWD